MPKKSRKVKSRKPRVKRQARKKIVKKLENVYIQPAPLKNAPGVFFPQDANITSPYYHQKKEEERQEEKKEREETRAAQLALTNALSAHLANFKAPQEEQTKNRLIFLSDKLLNPQAESSEPPKDYSDRFENVDDDLEVEVEKSPVYSIPSYFTGTGKTETGTLKETKASTGLGSSEISSPDFAAASSALETQPPHEEVKPAKKPKTKIELPPGAKGQGYDGFLKSALNDESLKYLKKNKYVKQYLDGEISRKELEEKNDVVKQLLRAYGIKRKWIQEDSDEE